VRREIPRQPHLPSTALNNSIDLVLVAFCLLRVVLVDFFDCLAFPYIRYWFNAGGFALLDQLQTARHVTPIN
jgi:hypothetical protein